jgi:hypothetical protein
LEWQRTNELVKETANRWSQVEKNYTTTNEACVGGVCGLGGGNRLGGEKVGMGNMMLSPMTSIATQGNVPSSKAPKSSIYKFIKDNDLHRCQREVAIPRLSEAFTNPIEEMTQILDDAVLSESEGQAEKIDGIYEYKCAPIGEHARKSAFKSGWQMVAESEAKVINEVGTDEEYKLIADYLTSIGKSPREIRNIMTISSTEDLGDLYDDAVKSKKQPTMESKGIGYYRTKENDIIDALGKTAAQRLLGE